MCLPKSHKAAVGIVSAIHIRAWRRQPKPGKGKGKKPPPVVYGWGITSAAATAKGFKIDECSEAARVVAEKVVVVKQQTTRRVFY